MKEIYLVVHMYDVYGGFGDAIGSEDVICVFEEEKKAEAFAVKYSNPRVYDRPYADLECGQLQVISVPLYGKEDVVPEYEWIQDDIGYDPDELIIKDDSE